MSSTGYGESDPLDGPTGSGDPRSPLELISMCFSVLLSSVQALRRV